MTFRLAELLDAPSSQEQEALGGGDASQRLCELDLDAEASGETDWSISPWPRFWRSPPSAREQDLRTTPGHCTHCLNPIRKRRKPDRPNPCFPRLDMDEACEVRLRRNGACGCGAPKNSRDFCYTCTPRRVADCGPNAIIVVLVSPRGFEREVVRRAGSAARFTLPGGIPYDQPVKGDLLASGVLVLDVTEICWAQARLVV